MPAIDLESSAVSTVCAPTLRGISAGILKELIRAGVDAVRPRVVGLNGQTIADPVLRCNQQPVITHRSARVQIDDVAVILPLVGVLKEQLPSLGCIRGCGTRTIRPAGDHATAAGQVNGRIALTDVQQVNNAVANIIRGYQPVSTNLSLDTEIPLIDVD